MSNIVCVPAIGATKALVVLVDVPIMFATVSILVGSVVMVFNVL